MEQGHNGGRASDEQRADPHRPSDLVGGHAQRRSPEFVEIDGEVAVGRDRVDVHGHVEPGRQRDDLLDRLNGAHLIVGEKHTDQSDVVAEHRVERSEVDAPQ